MGMLFPVSISEMKLILLVLARDRVNLMLF